MEFSFAVAIVVLLPILDPAAHHSANRVSLTVLEVVEAVRKRDWALKNSLPVEVLDKLCGCVELDCT